MPIVAATIAGIIQIWTEKKRASVTALKSVPPLATRIRNGPMKGTVPIISVATVVAQ